MPHFGDKTFLIAIAFFLIVTMAINIGFVMHFWKQYQSKMESIQSEIRKMKFSMKVEYEELSNLYSQKYSGKELESDFHLLLEDTFRQYS